MAAPTIRNTFLFRSDSNASNIYLINDAVSSDFMRLGRSSGSSLKSIESGLKTIGLIPADQSLISYTDHNPWKRGGAETYISDFTMVLNDNETLKVLHIIAKAIVRFGLSIDHIATEWLKRQKRLESFRINTPQHYAYFQGCIYQQYIPFELSNFIRSAPLIVRLQLKNNLQLVFERLALAGFRPIEPLHDLRTDGTRIFIVDFGEDLGGIDEKHQVVMAPDFSQRWLLQMSISDLSQSNCDANQGHH